MMNRPSVVLLLNALLVVPARAHAGASCPGSTVELSGGGAATYYVASLDTSLSVGGQFHVDYHLVTGTLDMDQNRSVAMTYVRASDAYDVAGVPAGTPVPVTATFNVHSDIYTDTGCGDPNCAGYVDMQIQHGVDVADQNHTLGPPPLGPNSATYADLLRLPMTIVAGQPEVVTFLLLGRFLPGGNEASDAHGVIGFTGLPAGASIVSCQGFSMGVTPTRHESWGRLKSIYR
jgi:hypothetical protein